MTDEELKTHIKSHMRVDRGNPFFVRKVMHRLPEREHDRRVTWILRVTETLAVVILGISWLTFMPELNQESSDSSIICSWIALLTATLFVVAVLMRRQLRFIIPPL